MMQKLPLDVYSLLFGAPKDRAMWVEEKVVLEEKGEKHGFDSKEDEVVPKVEDVSLVDGVFDGAFGGDGDEDFSIGEG
ncbi:hypothetical protein Tco_0673448, partial [Tanacetum coccineum]